jgi:predicted homoserine dehydrogenase-like protein
MNPRMLVEFVDGSKTMVEMACHRQRHRSRARRARHARAERRTRPDGEGADPEADGGMLSKKGVVDYTSARAWRPASSCIVEAEHPRIIERMDDLHVGHGPYYAFHRPYHLTSLEVPLTAARIMLYGKPDMVPLPQPVAEVCAVAKRDLAPGETFDAIGETCYRSWTMTVPQARSARRCLLACLRAAAILPVPRRSPLIGWPRHRLFASRGALPCRAAVRQIRPPQSALQ